MASNKSFLLVRLVVLSLLSNHACLGAHHLLDTPHPRALTLPPLPPLTSTTPTIPTTIPLNLRTIASIPTTIPPFFAMTTPNIPTSLLPLPSLPLLPTTILTIPSTIPSIPNL
ncbi:hypothetical protein AMTRI_Chr12g235760 [Amborella trichopoda]